MPRTRKNEAPIAFDEPAITGRYAELGDYTVAFEDFHTGMDPAPLFRGLPDDRCQCVHLGIVLSGQLDIRYTDGEETYLPGDAYLIRPGHLPLPHAGTEVVEFTPTELLQQTATVVGANMAAAAQAAGS